MPALIVFEDDEPEEQQVSVEDRFYSFVYRRIHSYEVVWKGAVSLCTTMVDAKAVYVGGNPDIPRRALKSFNIITMARQISIDRRLGNFTNKIEARK